MTKKETKKDNLLRRTVAFNKNTFDRISKEAADSQRTFVGQLRFIIDCYFADDDKYIDRDNRVAGKR